MAKKSSTPSKVDVTDQIPRARNRYQSIVLAIFKKHHVAGKTSFDFSRQEIEEVASQLGIKLPKNLGDVMYSFRYRNELPHEILSTASAGKEWIIEGKGRALYSFREAAINRITPRAELLPIKIPDATPEIIAAHALSDEQALLARVRYNRLIDIFLGITTYSLQNHLRTTVANVGQIEIDEIYVGVDKHGHQFVIPVQAKGGNDMHGAVQTRQDVRCCEEKFKHLSCRAVSAQFMDDQRIALFELCVVDDEVKVVDEKHYHLVPASQITAQDLAVYRSRSPL